MTYIPTAPDLKVQVADRIRRYRKEVDNGTLRNSLLDQLGREEAGRYTAVGGALVTVHATVHHREKPIYPTGCEQRVEVGAVAKCHGNGCTSPDFKRDDTGYFPLEADADVTAEAALPYVQAAREWAQAHAEKCRAQAYTS